MHTDKIYFNHILVLAYVFHSYCDHHHGDLQEISILVKHHDHYFCKASSGWLHKQLKHVGE
jgi:hypothetical protein